MREAFTRKDLFFLFFSSLEPDSGSLTYSVTLLLSSSLILLMKRQPVTPTPASLRLSPEELTLC